MSVNPDEVVAAGAAVQAAVLQGEVSDVLLLDVTPLSLGVETLGVLMTKVIERNTTIPTRRTEVFSTAEDNQPAVDVVVLQGERERAADNRVLGRLRRENIRPAPRGVPRIEVTFDIDANGIVDVAAKDKDTGVEQMISGSGTLEEADVQRMVADAERHRAEDARARELIEARNQLDTVAYQLERLLDGPRRARARPRVHGGPAGGTEYLAQLGRQAADLRQRPEVVSLHERGKGLVVEQAQAVKQKLRARTLHFPASEGTTPPTALGGTTVTEASKAAVLGITPLSRHTIHRPVLTADGLDRSPPVEPVEQCMDVVVHVENRPQPGQLHQVRYQLGGLERSAL